jgi:hypothetical protein
MRECLEGSDRGLPNFKGHLPGGTEEKHEKSVSIAGLRAEI